MTSDPAFVSGIGWVGNDPKVDTAFFVESLLFGDGIPKDFLDAETSFGGVPNGEAAFFPNELLFDGDGTPKPGESFLGGNLKAEGGALNGVGGVLKGEGGDLNGETTFFGNALLFDDDTSVFPTGSCLGKDPNAEGTFFSTVLLSDFVTSKPSFSSGVLRLGGEPRDEAASLLKAVLLDGGTPNSTFLSGVPSFEGAPGGESLLF